MSRTLPLPLFLALLLAAALSTPAFAQTVQGRLVDDATRAPVAEAQVRAQDAGGAQRDVVTAADGAFTLDLPAGGRYALRVARLGYQTLEALELTVAAGDTLELEVRIAAGAVPLAPLTVTSRRGPAENPALARRGFYARRAAYERHGALFLDREHLSRINAARTTDVFRHLPGVYVRGGRNAGTLTMRGSCEASLFVDGQQVNRLEVSRDVQTSRRSILDGARQGNATESYDIARQGTRVDPGARINIDDLVAASSILAVEVYQTTQVPTEFATFQARPCGAVLIWTGGERA